MGIETSPVFKLWVIIPKREAYNYEKSFDS
jgi:hypothetical protein